MSNYIIAYHGGRTPKSREEGAAGMERWSAWVDGLGAAVINPGTPLAESKIVSADGISDDSGSLIGYTIVQAGSLETALGMAKDCPHLEYGTIEVAQMKEM